MDASGAFSLERTNAAESLPARGAVLLLALHSLLRRSHQCQLRALTMNRDLGLSAYVYAWRPARSSGAYCLLEVLPTSILERSVLGFWIARIIDFLGVAVGGTAL